MIDAIIKDGTGTGSKARVSPFGQVITGPVDYNSVSTQTMAVNDQVYNFVEPIAGRRIVVDGLLIYADKAVGANDASIVIYESTEGPDSATASVTILETEMLKKSSRDIFGVNFLCQEGSWINATTNDNNVFLTILYYYVPITDFT